MLDIIEVLFKILLVVCFVFPFWAVWHEKKKKREEQEYLEQEEKRKRDRINKLTQDASKHLSSFSNSPSIDAFFSDFDAFESAMKELDELGIRLPASGQRQMLSLSKNGAYHDELLCKCIDRSYKRALEICNGYTPSARDEHMSSFFAHLRSFSNRYSSEVSKYIKALEYDSPIPSPIGEAFNSSPQIVTVLHTLGDLPNYAKYETQNPALSYEAAQLADAEFALRFLQHIHDEVARDPNAVSYKKRHRVPRDLIRLRTLPPSALESPPIVAFPDLSFLSDAEYLYVYLASQLAGKFDNPYIRYGVNGLTQSLFPDLPRAVALLRKLGFFEELTPANRSFDLTVTEMRNLAQEHNLKPASKLRREELEQFLFDHLPDDILAKHSHPYFVLSAFGNMLVDSLYTDARILPTPLRFPDFSKESIEDDEGELVVFDDLD